MLELKKSNSTLATTESVLMMLQKSTLENKSLEALIGKDFALRADFPSLVMFVAQKVLVKMENTRTTMRDSANSSSRPIAFFTNSASKV